MKQPKIIITDNNGKELCIRKVVELKFDSDGLLSILVVDFFDDGNSNDYLPFINNNGEFKSINNNLKGVVFFK